MKGIGFGIADMRAWDMTLLKRYPPRYHKVNRACTFCALGPCDLDKNRRGACGQDQETFIAREALLLAVTGAAAHAAHARDVVTRLIADMGPDLILDLGEWVQITMPITLVVAGTRPRLLGDLLPVLEYIDSQIVRLLASVHFGGESSTLDLESKTLHAGTMDILSMEIAEIAQISGYNFPKGEKETSIIPVGLQELSGDKPLILCVGHHSDIGCRVLNKLDSADLDTAIEVAGLCCTAHDMARGHTQGRTPGIAGNLRNQLSFIRSGRADIVVADQQCIRLDLLSETLHTGAFFIATSDQACAGLPDETGMDTEELAAELSGRQMRGVFISDPEKAASLAVAIARRYGRVAGPAAAALPQPAVKVMKHNNTEIKQTIYGIWGYTRFCDNCGLCTKHCPVNLPVSKAVFTAGEAISGSNEVADILPLSAGYAFKDIHPRCITCGRCDSACPQHIPVMSLIESSFEDNAEIQGGWMRVGRGPIDDYEIKSTGPSIVLGDIPGVIAFLTCPEYHDGRDTVSWMAQILAERGYIVLAAGCVAMDIGIGENNVYRQFPGTFDCGGIINTGSCISSSHAIGALIKVASIFLHRRLDGNYAEIADYILNRIGAAGIMWGGITPKSFSASAGANRLGIPVVFGPHGYKFRRTLEGAHDAGGVFDARGGRYVHGRLMPAHLSVVSNTREDAIVQLVKLCIRPNDTTWGRQKKLRNYIELSKVLLDNIPCDLSDVVRVPDDIPEELREELMENLKTTGWQPSFIPDPTLLQRLVRHE